MWLAGGGVKGGMVHGATDEFGIRGGGEPGPRPRPARDDPALLGIDHEKLTFRYSGRDFRLTDVSGVVVKDILA